MTLTLDLPAAVIEAVTNEAQRRGSTPEQVLAEDAQQKYASLAFSSRFEPETGADLLEVWKAEGAFLPEEEREEHQERMQQIRTQDWRRA